MRWGFWVPSTVFSFSLEHFVEPFLVWIHPTAFDFHLTSSAATEPATLATKESAGKRNRQQWIGWTDFVHQNRCVSWVPLEINTFCIVWVKVIRLIVSADSMVWPSTMNPRWIHDGSRMDPLLERIKRTGKAFRSGFLSKALYRQSLAHKVLLVTQIISSRRIRIGDHSGLESTLVFCFF